MTKISISYKEGKGREKQIAVRMLEAGDTVYRIVHCLGISKRTVQNLTLKKQLTIGKRTRSGYQKAERKAKHYHLLKKRNRIMVYANELDKTYGISDEEPTERFKESILCIDGSNND